MISKNTGIVSVENQQYFSNSEISTFFIHTIAKKEDTKIVVSELFLMDENANQTQFVHQQILSTFLQKVTIQKNEFGIPFLYQKDKKLALSISISHHGKFGAFVVL